jgi:hypothetical protein
LILNVDGAIGTIFVDILRNSGMFTAQEARETIEIGALNGLFVLGRSLGFIGLFYTKNKLTLIKYKFRTLFGSTPIEAATLSPSMGRYQLYYAGSRLWRASTEFMKRRWHWKNSKTKIAKYIN